MELHSRQFLKLRNVMAKEQLRVEALRRKLSGGKPDEPAPASPPDLERRLSRIEASLDALRAAAEGKPR